MIGKTMTIGCAVAMLAAPVLAQTVPPTDPASPGQPGTMPDTTMMPGNTMSNSMDPMTDSNMPRMSRSDRTAMKRCQGMSADRMAKNSRCTKLMQKYPTQNPQTPM